MRLGTYDLGDAGSITMERDGKHVRVCHKDMRCSYLGKYRLVQLKRYGWIRHVTVCIRLAHKRNESGANHEGIMRALLLLKSLGCAE